MTEDFFKYIAEDSKFGKYLARLRAGLVSKEEKERLAPVAPFYFCGEGHFHRMNQQPLEMVITVGDLPDRPLATGSISCFNGIEGADFYELGFRASSDAMLKAEAEAGLKPLVKLSIYRLRMSAGRG